MASQVVMICFFKPTVNIIIIIVGNSVITRRNVIRKISLLVFAFAARERGRANRQRESCTRCLNTQILTIYDLDVFLTAKFAVLLTVNAEP